VLAAKEGKMPMKLALCPAIIEETLTAFTCRWAGSVEGREHQVPASN
jgi:hypothetical protein